jgi:Fe-S-cluster containining protein
MCCASSISTSAFVDVTEEDKARLGKDFVRLHVVSDAIVTVNREVKRGPLKGVCLDKCAALIGDVGWGVHCRVYEDRPEVCRSTLEPGDDLCHAIRAELLARAITGDER